MLSSTPAAIGQDKAFNRDRMWGIVLPLSVFAVGGLVWQLLTVDSESLILPTFFESLTGLYELVVGGEIWTALLLSNHAMIVGYIISVILGVAAGLALARLPVVNEYAEPYVNMWLAVPTAPLIPLVLMALGIGLWSRVTVVVIFSVVYILVNTRAGVRGVDKSLIEMAQSFGANERDVWRRVLLPGAMPAVLAGLRLGMARAIDGMVVAELLLVAVGIGHLLLKYRSLFEGGLMFATVIILVLEASILITLLRTLERRLTPWVQEIR